MRFQEITVPAEWTAEKDLEDFIDRFGEPDNSYFQFVIERVYEEYERLERTLNRALAYFGRGLNGSIQEKIAGLQQHVLAHAPSEAYRSRFRDDLDDCFRVLKEYERILPEYEGRGENNWLFPIAQLADVLGGNALPLEESMVCEHTDFDSRTDLPEKL